MNWILAGTVFFSALLAVTCLGALVVEAVRDLWRTACPWRRTALVIATLASLGLLLNLVAAASLYMGTLVR